MANRRVFIFWTHPLFHETVKALLNHPHIEWAGSSSDYAAGWEPGLISPDTILVEEDEAGSPPAELIKLLETSRGNVRVVGLNLNDNEMRVYNYVQRTVCKADDLLQWILND